jgi:F0F1-type ATP synthase beta subunit
MRVGLTALTMAEYFHVILTNKTFCYLSIIFFSVLYKAGSRVSTLLGRMPSSRWLPTYTYTKWVVYKNVLLQQQMDFQSHPIQTSICTNE